MYFPWPTWVFLKKTSVCCPNLKIGTVPLKKSEFPFSNNNNKSKHFVSLTMYVPGTVLSDISFCPLILRTVLRSRYLYCYPHSTAGENEADRVPVCSWLCPHSCVAAVGRRWWWLPLWAGHLVHFPPAAPVIRFITCLAWARGLGFWRRQDG